MTENIRVGIVGYGNLGKGSEIAVKTHLIWKLPPFSQGVTQPQ